MCVFATGKWAKQSPPSDEKIDNLHKDDERDTQVCVDNAEERGKSVERLRDDDATFVRRAYFGSHLVFHESCSPRVPQTAKERGTRKKDIEPVHQQGSAKSNVVG
jgi:hypothetical protein